MPVHPSSSDILEVYGRLLNAWNSRDARAFAAVFTEDGSAVGFDGSQMNGRDSIDIELSAIFANHQTATYVAKIRELRSLDQNTTLIRAVVGMIPSGQQALNPSANAVQSIVVLRQADGFRIALLHNTPAAFHGRPELASQLTEELTHVFHAGRLIDVS